jgi:hypothetical protein
MAQDQGAQVILRAYEREGVPRFWTNDQVFQLAKLAGITMEELVATLNMAPNMANLCRKTNRWAGATALVLHFMRQSLCRSYGFDVVDGLMRKRKD